MFLLQAEDISDIGIRILGMTYEEFAFFVTVIILITFLASCSIVSSILTTCCRYKNDLTAFSPGLYVTTKYFYNKVLKNAYAFLLLNVGLSILSYVVMDLKTNMVKTIENDGIVNITMKNDLYTLNYDNKVVFKPNTKITKELSNVDIANFELLINILLPLFFGACLAKYSTARDAFLGFIGEVEFMAIYFITLTTTKKFVPGKLRFQLKKIKILLAAMPTTVFELVQDHFYGGTASIEDLVYDNTELIETSFGKELENPNEYDEMSHNFEKWKCDLNMICTSKTRDKSYLNIDPDPLKQAIFKDLKKLHEVTGLGVFECMLHMLMGYIDKIKVDESGYNTSIERDFIVKWNHINAGWGTLFNNVTYNTPIIIDLLLRFTLLTYAWVRPRSFKSCEDQYCSVFFSGALFNVFIYAVIYFAGETLQDPFQSWHINPTVRKDAYDTQDHVNKLFDLFDKTCDNYEQTCKEYSFTYNDGFDGKDDDRLISLRKYMPMGLYETSLFMGELKHVFKNSKTWSKTTRLGWDDVGKIMTDENDWDKTFRENFGSTFNNPSKFLLKSLKSEDYYKLMLSRYCSDEVKTHLNQLSYSYFNYNDAKKAIVTYVDNLQGGDKMSSVCKNNIDSSIMKSPVQSITDENLTKFKGCNNDGSERTEDGDYLFYIDSILKKIFKIVEDNYEFDNANKNQKETVKKTQKVARLFQHKIDIMSNTNSRKGLKYL